MAQFVNDLAPQIAFLPDTFRLAPVQQKQTSTSGEPK
jgi:hypothetical protein